HKTVVRIPDLGVVCNDNNVPLGDHDRSYKGIFDICIESISDSKQLHVDRDVIHKRNEYAEAGVREYYILDERGKETQFYQLNTRGIYIPIRPQNGVIRSTVLPGFQFRYGDLYRQPTLIELAQNPVYQAFVLPEYQAQKARADRLAEKLRAFGIAEDELE
ncbi:MAG: Uma2 family endonuclease, partial [Caldilineaceae bacterium]|nr:Uma2 family endonuclease [Caldilineaceae bacterium]